MDLSLAIGGPPVVDTKKAFVIISEYNRNVQGFLVHAVERIVNLNCKDIHSPADGTAASSSYLTAVTHVDGNMVEVIDVERVLAEVMGSKEDLSQEVLDQVKQPVAGKNLVLVVDDSLVARKQVCNTIEKHMTLETIIAKDGKQAINLLKQWADTEDPGLDHLALVISDIEMPEMDGYTFTTEVPADERLKQLYIILHTSMSGVFNQTMVDKVGADKFIAKFDGDVLAQAVIDVMNELSAEKQ